MTMIVWGTLKHTKYFEILIINSIIPWYYIYHHLLLGRMFPVFEYRATNHEAKYITSTARQR